VIFSLKPHLWKEWNEPSIGLKQSTIEGVIKWCYVW